MHGGKFPRSLRLRATSFGRNYIEKFLQSCEKSARFSASERNNRANFAPSRDIIVRRNRENFNESGKAFANSGFTIIEVALVLAIAGLIFLVVFLALPALQRSQRDNARKQDVGRVAAALQQYLADNNDFYNLSGGGGNGNYIAYYIDNQTHAKYIGDHGVEIDPDILKGYAGKLSQATYIGVANGAVLGCNTKYSGLVRSWGSVNHVTVIVSCSCDNNNPISVSPVSYKHAAIMVTPESGGYYCMAI